MFPLIAGILLAFVATARPEEPAPIQRRYFTYYLDNTHYLDEADSVLNATREELNGMLRDTLSYVPSVYIVGDLTRFKALVGGYFPDWGAAAAAPPRQLIAIKSPDRFNLNRSLPELLAHEYAHLALEHRTGVYSTPRWFQEGLAMLVSTEWSWSDNLAMGKAAVFRQLIPLADIDSVNRFTGGKAHVAYAESYLAVEYFFRAYGIDAVNIFLDTVASGGSIDSALMASTGSNYADFEKEFRATLVSRFNVASIFMDTIFFWIILAVVVLIGFFLQRRRRKRYHKQWDEYDTYHSTDFDYGDPDHPEKIDDDDEPWRQ